MLATQEVAEMTVAPETREVRRLVIWTLRQFGASGRNLFDLEKTATIDDGRYMARSYRIDGFAARWLVALGIVQFYDAEDNMLATLNVLTESEPLEAAA